MTRFAGCGMKWIALAVVALASASWARARVVYVDDSAPPGGDGTSWTTAYNSLNVGFNDAWADPNVTQLRVAGGTYSPADSNSPFDLRKNLTVAGGYAGLADPNAPDRRDLAAFASVLSGKGMLGRMIRCLQQDETAVLDGFQVVDFVGRPSPADGGAFWASGGGFTVRDCVFARNDMQDYAGHGSSGGAIHMYSTTGRFVRCVFVDNSAGNGNNGESGREFGKNGGHGGAIAARLSTAYFRQCTFVSNRAGHGDHGGHFSRYATFGGRGGFGGHVFATQCPHLEFDNCLLANGRTGTGGDGGFYQGAFMAGNGGDGGAIYSDTDLVILRDCTVANNVTGLGGKGYSSEYDGLRGTSGGVLAMGSLTVVNTIAWGNQARATGERGQIGHGAVAPDIDYFCVEGWTGGWGGEGNHGRDPLFVDPNAGNFRLAAGSPVIDAADNRAVPAEILYDLDGQRRFIDDPLTSDFGFGDPPVVDMGCYEYRGKFKAGDLNCDGTVDFGDITPFVLLLSDPGAWQQQYPDCPKDNGDINYDRKADFGDINPFVELLSE